MTEFPAAAYPSQPNFIFACLHRDILPAVAYVKPSHCTLLVSDSPDGDILVRSLGDRPYKFLRGATGQAGARALVALRRTLESGGSIGLAVDGPKGPYGQINDGAMILASQTGVPILPLVAEVSRKLVLSTWDRTVVPLPFSCVKMRVGPLLHLPVGADQAVQNQTRFQLAEFFGVQEIEHEDS